MDEMPKIDANTLLAQQRTELALERTQLAWVRTVFAFVAAAVALDRAVVTTHAHQFLPDDNWIAAAQVASLILGVGSTVLLAMATAHYVYQCRRVARTTGQRQNISWPSLLLSLFVIGLGVVASWLLLTI